MELARRACEKIRRPCRALHALRDPDGGVLHADPRKNHQSTEGPRRVLMPKTTRVVMPQLGESVHEGTISKWLVKPGDKVVEFEPMLEVDTDKVNAEVPAPVTGILREILAKEGETVQAGAEIAVVEVGGDGPDSSNGTKTASPEAPVPAPAVAAPKAAAKEPAPEAAVPSPRQAEEKAVPSPRQAEEKAVPSPPQGEAQGVGPGP